MLRTDEGALTATALAIIATVGSSIVLGFLYGAFSLWLDVQTIKAQQQFFHGPWPPVRGTPP